MPTLSGSVGDGGVNKTHDVALVHLMLRLAKDPKTKKSFFGNDFDAKFSKHTTSAISAFQAAFSLLPAPPATGATPPPSSTSPADKKGLIDPAGVTLPKLASEAAAGNADYLLIRALPDSKMIYLEMSQAEFDVRLKAVTDSELKSGFKTKVIALVRKVYAQHKIALAGWGKLSYRRSFANQHKVLSEGTSQAGPGESNHQFGQALDVGYVGLRYVRPNGHINTILDEDHFDKSLIGWQIAALYKARNDIWEKAPQGNGTLFRIRLHGGDNDPNHFQNFNQFPALYPDPTVDIGTSLAFLLSAVSGHNWVKRPHGIYASDLGTGATPVDIGTADQIWTGTSSFTRAKYLAMLNEVRKANGETALHDKDVSAADFNRVNGYLKSTFEEADNQWSQWEPRDSNGNPI